MKKIQEERKQELINSVEKQVNNNKIDNYKVNKLANDNNEYKFINNWIDEKNIEIIGIDGTNINQLDIEKNFKPKRDLPNQYNNLENQEAFERLKKGDKKARKELIEHNLQLALYASEKFFPLLPCEKEDKEEYAKIALIEAIDSYNYEKGNSFYKYLSQCIYREIERNMLNENQYSMHETNLKQLKQINKVEDAILKKTGKMPTDEELCTLIPNISKLQIDRLKIFRVMNKSEEISKVYEESEELFKIEPELETDNIVEQKLKREDIEKALSILTEEEREIIKDRFGLDGRYPQTYKQLEKKYPYTGSGIQYKVQSCLKKIEQSKYANLLKEYIKEEPVTFNKKRKLKKAIELFKQRNKAKVDKNKQKEQPFSKLSKEELCAEVEKTKNAINSKNKELMELAAKRMAIAEEQRRLKELLKEYEQQYKNISEKNIEH